LLPAPDRYRSPEALEAVRSGERVYVHEGCGTPQPLIDALVARAGELRDVEILHMLTFGDAAYTRPEYQGIFRHNGLFLGGNVRPAVQEKFVASYRAAGGECQYEVFAGCEHLWVGEPGPQTDRAHEMVKQFIAKQLKAKSLAA